MQITCPYCNTVIGESVRDDGPVTCPTCAREFKVPKTSDNASSPNVVLESDNTSIQGKNEGNEKEGPSGSPLWKKRIHTIGLKVKSFLQSEKQTVIGIPPDKPFQPSRIIPLAACCIFFGWIWRCFYDYNTTLDDTFGGSIVPFLLLAIGSLALVFASFRHFIRPEKLWTKRNLLCAVFTGTIGVALLDAVMPLAEQYADAPTGIKSRAHFLFYLVGVAYNHIDDPHLATRFFSYIFGVGLCEETTKLLPLFWILLRKSGRSLSYRDVLMAGFFSGIGFGIAEALQCYPPWKGVFYFNSNIIRWFACVPSHAIYATIDAAFLWWLMPKIAKESDRGGCKGDKKCFTLCIVATLCVSALHGVYDTLVHISYMGLILNAASIVLLVYIVNLVYRRSKQRTQYGGPLCDAGASETSVRTFGKTFSKLYILAALSLVIASAFADEGTPTSAPGYRSRSKEKFHIRNALQAVHDIDEEIKDCSAITLPNGRRQAFFITKHGSLSYDVWSCVFHGSKTSVLTGKKSFPGMVKSFVHIHAEEYPTVFKGLGMDRRLITFKSGESPLGGYYLLINTLVSNTLPESELDRYGAAIGILGDSFEKSLSNEDRF